MKIGLILLRDKASFRSLSVVAGMTAPKCLTQTLTSHAPHSRNKQRKRFLSPTDDERLAIRRPAWSDESVCHTGENCCCVQSIRCATFCRACAYMKQYLHRWFIVQKCCMYFYSSMVAMHRASCVPYMYILNKFHRHVLKLPCITSSHVMGDVLYHVIETGAFFPSIICM